MLFISALEGSFFFNGSFCEATCSFNGTDTDCLKHLFFYFKLIFVPIRVVSFHVFSILIKM